MSDIGIDVSFGSYKTLAGLNPQALDGELPAQFQLTTEI